MKLNLDIKKTAGLFIILALILLAVDWLKPILLPVAYGGFIAFLLYPVVKFLMQKGGLHEAIAMIVAYLGALIVIVGVYAFFTWQITELVQSLKGAELKISGQIEQILTWLNDNANISKQQIKDSINNNIGTIISKPLDMVGTGVKQLGTALAGFALSIVYSIMILYFRRGIRNFFVVSFGNSNSKDVRAIIDEVQEVLQKYLYGWLLVMAVMGTINSLAFLAIGIRQPFLWGFLAGTLSIIPYIGTTIGASLPVLYAFLFSGTLWQPFAIIVVFIAYQFFEDNFFKPRVLGARVDLNQLVALFAMILGGFIWGLGGLIIALPVMATLKIVLSHIDQTKQLALFMGKELRSKENVFGSTS